MMKRFAVWLACLLTKGTECRVVRSTRLEDLGRHTDGLGRYVEASGGLQDPRRVRAFHVVVRAVENIRHAMKDLAA